MTYTYAAGLALVLAVVVDLAVTRTALVATRAFWVTYAVVLTFQLLVDGVLTGLGVVRYRRSTILGPRLVFAPVEDIAFGFALILATLTAWVWLERHDAERADHAPWQRAAQTSTVSPRRHPWTPATYNRVRQRAL